jgi:SM-20-related protein
MDSSIFENIATRGWTFVDSWISPIECNQLLDWAKVHLQEFTTAGIGKDANVNSEIRSDRTLWLNGFESAAIQNIFSKFLDFQSVLNRELSLPINNFETHFAFYPPQAKYQAHIDQSAKSHENSERLISFVLYLNTKWQPGDGGELQIYGDSPVAIQPLAGRLVLFRSKDILHAVNQTQTERFSITGWFRRNSF